MHTDPVTRLIRRAGDRFIGWAQYPTTWYLGLVATLLVAGLVLSWLDLPAELTVVGRWALLSIGALPLAIVGTMVSARLPRRTAGAATHLAAQLRWARGLLWTGLTFAVGAYVATLMQFDLEKVKKADVANEYFFRILALIVGAVAIVALIGMLLAGAWAYVTASNPARDRALLLGASTSFRRSLPLGTRMWLESESGENLPTLSAYPRLERTLRQLSSEAGRVVVAGSMAMLSVCLLNVIPLLGHWLF